MTAIVLRNESPHKFTDISSESFRQYNFGTKGFVRIDDPNWLSAGPNGHRLVDGTGQSHYVPSGWLNITWQAKDGQPHFVK